MHMPVSKGELRIDVGEAISCIVVSTIILVIVGAIWMILTGVVCMIHGTASEIISMVVWQTAWAATDASCLIQVTSWWKAVHTMITYACLIAYLLIMYGLIKHEGETMITYNKDDRWG